MLLSHVMRMNNIITRYYAADGAGSPGGKPNDPNINPPSPSVPPKDPEDLRSISKNTVTKDQLNIQLSQLISNAKKIDEAPTQDFDAVAFFQKLSRDVLQLVRLGANPNHETDGQPLLHNLHYIYLGMSKIAREKLLSSGFKEIVIELVKLGANPAIEVSFPSVISSFIGLLCFDNLNLQDLQKILLITPEAKGNLTGNTLLHQLIEAYYPSKHEHINYNAQFTEIVKAMIAAGINPNQLNNQGISAKDAAIQMNCPDQIKVALDILDSDESRPTPIELYEQGNIDELLERKRSFDFITEDGITQKMIEAGDSQTLKRFLSSSDINFSANPEFWSEILNLAIANLIIYQSQNYAKTNALKEIILFLLNNGVNPDYICKSTKPRFISPSEMVREDMLELPDEVITSIQDKSIYLNDPKLISLRIFLEQYCSNRSVEGIFTGPFPQYFYRDQRSDLADAYNQYILDPNENNFENFEKQFIQLKDLNPWDS